MLDIIRNRAQSWGVKIVFGIIILVFVFWGMGNFNPMNPDLIVRVNGNAITKADYNLEFQNYVRAVKMRMPNMPDEFFESEEQRKRVLGLMVDKMLLTQAAENIGLSASVPEVQKEIMSMPRFLDENNEFSMLMYTHELDNMRISKAEFEADVQQSILLAKLQAYIMSAAEVTEIEAKANFQFMEEKRKVDYVLFLSSDYADKVKISEEAIAEYYEKNKQEFTVPRRIDIEYLHITPQVLASRYTVSQEAVAEYYDKNKSKFIEMPQAKISHILFAINRDASEEERKNITAKANNVYNQAASGADFASLARNNSDDPSATNGGDMGWMVVGDLAPVLAEVIEPLKPGEVSRPFNSPMGIHIFKVDARKDSRQKPLSEVESEVSMIIASEQAAAEMPGILDNTVADILNGVSFAEITDKVSLSATKVSGLQREDAERELALSKDAVESLFLTPEGITVDRPLPSGNGYMFVSVTKVDEEHIAPLADVKDRILAVLKADEARAMASREADTVLALLKNGDPLPSGIAVKRSGFFTRQNAPEEFGVAPGLLEAVFTGFDKQAWQGPFAAARGPVLIKLDSIEQPSDADWANAKDLFIARMEVYKQENLLQAYLQDLQGRAKMEDYTPGNIGLEY